VDLLQCCDREIYFSHQLPTREHLSSMRTSENSYSTTFVNKGKQRKGRSYSERTPAQCALVISTESLNDPLHLVVIVGTKRGGPYIARRAKLNCECGGTLVIVGFP
jgi:hypothetical protein